MNFAVQFKHVDYDCLIVYIIDNIYDRIYYRLYILSIKLSSIDLLNNDHFCRLTICSAHYACEVLATAAIWREWLCMVYFVPLCPWDMRHVVHIIMYQYVVDMLMCHWTKITFFEIFHGSKISLNIASKIYLKIYV